MRKLTPFNDRVIVRPIEEDEQLYGNIIVPDMGKEKPEMGEVVSTGPGRMSEFGKHIPVKAKVGSIVLVPKMGTICLLYTSPSPRDRQKSRMPSSA